MKTKTYKFKLYNREDNNHLFDTIDLSADIYNHCISLYKRHYRIFKKHLNKYSVQKHLTKLKNGKFKHLRNVKSWEDVPSQAIQNIVDRIDNGYNLFFRNVKLGIRCSPPNFKKKQKYKSFTTKQAGYKLLDGNKICIDKRIYSYWKSREIPLTSEIKTLTVKRTIRGCFIYLVVKEEETVNAENTMTGKSVGFDFGLKVFLKASDGNDINMPKLFKKNLKSVKKLSRLYKKRKGKHGTWKSLSKLYDKIANQRRDLHWKIAQDLVNRYDVLCFETLDLQGMSKKYQKSIHDFGFSNFMQILKYLTEKQGKRVVQISQWYPSSKTCSKCLHKKDELKISERVYVCSNCGSVMDRDDNASQNILREGTVLLYPLLEASGI